MRRRGARVHLARQRTSRRPPCRPPARLQHSAAVVYESAEGVSEALAHAGGGQVVEFELQPPAGPRGLKAWVAAHKAARPGNAVLQQQVGGQVQASQQQRTRRAQLKRTRRSSWRRQPRAATATHMPTPPAWCSLLPPHASLRAWCVVQLDAWMESFDAAEAAREAARRAAMTEDGWTVVVRNKVGLDDSQLHSAACVCSSVVQHAAAAGACRHVCVCVLLLLAAAVRLLHCRLCTGPQAREGG